VGKDESSLSCLTTTPEYDRLHASTAPRGFGRAVEVRPYDLLKGSYKMSQELGLEEAIDIAMDAELKAQAFYVEAAMEVQDPAGRDLLGRLAAFEQYHYQQLTELVRSLRATGRFIAYKARTVEEFRPLGESQNPPPGATGAGPLRDVAEILSLAIAKEKVAGERYQALAQVTTDADGQAMFRNLAHEESIHQRILEDEFFSLSNRGVWGWSGMYGE